MFWTRLIRAFCVAERRQGNEQIGNDSRFITRIGENHVGRPGRIEGPSDFQSFVSTRPVQFHEERARYHLTKTGLQQGCRNGQLLFAFFDLQGRRDCCRCSW